MPKTANQDSKLDLIATTLEESNPSPGRNSGFRRVCISKTNVLATDDNDHVKVQDENQTQSVSWDEYANPLGLFNLFPIKELNKSDSIKSKLGPQIAKQTHAVVRQPMSPSMRLQKAKRQAQMIKTKI